MCVLLIFLVALIVGISAQTKSQCVDSMARPGNCIPVSGCPYLIEEFYDQVRRSPDAIDFQSFITQSLCGFDGFRFLICCTIRINQNDQQQLQQQIPWYNQPSSSSIFHFAPLGNPVDLPATVAPVPNPIQPLPISPTPLPPIPPTQNNVPVIIAPVPSQDPQVLPSTKQPPIVIVVNPVPLDSSPTPLPVTMPPPVVKTSDPQDGQCGVTSAFTNRVVGGSAARKGAYPWMAALGYIEPASPTVLKFFCSGSLISKSYVLTAGHCVSPTLTMVRLGAHDLIKLEPSAVDVKIKNTIVHDKFDRKTISNDIALLQLSDPVSFTEFIKPICLPEDIKFIQQDFVGNNPFIAGWGTTQFQGDASNVLRDAQVPILDTKACMANYSTVYRPVEVTDTLICAGSYITDACQGDSGGPLMMPQMEDRSFRYYIIGLVSYGYECARAGFPGVYTRVAVYMQWIKNNMN